MKLVNISLICAAALTMPSLTSCENQDGPSSEPVDDGMVEVRPVISDVFSSIPRDAADLHRGESRTYDKHEDTNEKLKSSRRLPKGSTVWLIAESADDPTKLVKRSYAVYNSSGEAGRSYLVPCTVDDKGEAIDLASKPMYLKNGKTYKFYAVSPARKLDEEKFAQGKVAFKVKNGEFIYANDCRYAKTTPKTITVAGSAQEAVCEVELSPMMNQTAELKFKIEADASVHDLGIQPSGIDISGLQHDDPDGVDWHMSQFGGENPDEPMTLTYGYRGGVYHQYDYTIAEDGSVNIDVGILPMWNISRSIIIVFRLKVNGVPSSFEMMLNEKDFKAGYSYGYKGTISIESGVDVITWQYVTWETDVELPID